ncbi:putative alpha-L-fucosidase [Helianthus anomalus]
MTKLGTFERCFHKLALKFRTISWYGFLYISFFFYFNAGLKYGTVACCGNRGGRSNFNPQVFCGRTKFINGQNLTALACDDPENYASWDGVHTTEAANKITVDGIFRGDFTDPHFEIQCS